MSSPSSPRPLSAAQALRRATAEAHGTVDALFSRVDLASAARYRAFLSAQARAHLPVEAALEDAGVAGVIEDWPARRRAAALRADLDELGVLPDEGPAPTLADTAAIAGAAYVLEGSRLGGAMLSEMVGAGLPTRFLAAPAPRGAWRTLLLRLDTLLAEPAELERAVVAARGVFALFAAGRTAMEPAHG